MKSSLINPLPMFEVVMKPYKDGVIANVKCNKCGIDFGMTLHGQTDGMCDDYMVQRIFRVAGEKHRCDPAAVPTKEIKAGAQEGDRIVNKYHEKKLKAKMRGTVENDFKFLKDLPANRTLPGQTPGNA